MIKTQKAKQYFNKQALLKGGQKETKLIPGNLVNLKITAVGANNVGINEFSFGIPVLVPNAKLGDTVQVKILKILTVKKIVLAKLVKVLKGAGLSNLNSSDANLPSLISGTCLDITINKLGPNSTGIADLPNTYNNINKIIVKKSFINLGEKVNVIVTRIKKNYAFAVIQSSTQQSKILSAKQFELNTKFTVVLPKKAKRYLKHIVVKVPNLPAQNLAFNNNVNNNFFVNGPTNTILFVKPSLGVKLGDKVQIQITKFFKINNTQKYNIAIAKIIKLNPISAMQKKMLVRANIRQMLKSGMHYGEKAIKCNARMKNFVWTSSNITINRLGVSEGQWSLQPETTYAKQSASVNPVIKKGRNIINLLKTRRCLNKALAQLTKYAAKGKTFLFVGTKKAAAGLVSRAALFSKKAFFVNTRWLGGMLTNWKTILKSISKIRPILKEKQIIIKDILAKRQNIKMNLIQKAKLLRKKSKLMVKKGKLLTTFFKQGTEKTNVPNVDTTSKSFSDSQLFVQIKKQVNNKRKEFVSKGILLLEKQRQLFVKQKELVLQSQALKSKAIELTNTYRQLLNNLICSRKKLRELCLLLIVSKELQTFKQQAKQDNQTLYMVSYNKFKTLNKEFIISNPPKEILNKMVSIIKGQENKLNLKSVTKYKTLIISQLLSKFNLFVPTIKASIKNLQAYQNLVALNKVVDLLNVVKNKMAEYVILKNKLAVELQKIKHTSYFLRNIIRILRRKLKQISAQKRFIKFLPKLRYLPTPANNIEQTARFLMKKFVDPKMKYPMDSIYDEKLSRQTKKVAASRKKKWQRLEKYLGGISNMTKIKEKQIRNNVAIIIGQQEEMNAVRECQKLGIKMFHIVDTNCNPGFADHFIPANDDARNSIKYILGKFLTRIRLAQKLQIKFKKAKIKKKIISKQVK
uniref:Small ribosomal subunit protein uS2c n=1 Tax=Astrephomene gubernaculifera TaxID=47775 RepID=A0A7R6ZN25_9CHLO|nr:ribosomal protein S2 [Astrephomene gubernaculifera]